MALTRQQREIRRRAIGSSEIAAVCGLDPERSPMDVWLHKMGMVEDDAGEELELQEAIKLPVAARAAARLAAMGYRKGTTVTHPQQAWMSSTLDFIGSWDVPGAEPEERIIKVRCVDVAEMSRWDGDTLPPHAAAQVQWQMAVSGIRRGHMAALFSWRSLRLYALEADAAQAAELQERADAFWRKHVLTRSAPPMDGSPACDSYLAKKFKGAAGAELKATPELEQLAAGVKQARLDLARAEWAKKLAEQRIKEAMGEAQVLELESGELIRWAITKGRVNDSAVVRELAPPAEVLERHRLPNHRRFTVPKSWGGDSD